MYSPYIYIVGYALSLGSVSYCRPLVVHRYVFACVCSRLITVIDYDVILVMGGGRLLESGLPSELLQRKGGELNSMAAAIGGGGYEMLLDRAKSRARDVGDCAEMAAWLPDSIDL